MFQTVIIDDVVSIEEQDKFYKLVSSGPWLLVEDMSYNNSTSPSYGFNQPFRMPNNKGTYSPLYETVAVPIINAAINKLNLAIKDIVTARAFLQVPLAPEFYKGKNGIHLDMATKHVAGVYYCCDSDGDTIIYDQTIHDTQPGSVNVELSIQKTVSPKKGRLVLFDGARYHCSSQPKYNKRMIINFNVV